MPAVAAFVTLLLAQAAHPTVPLVPAGTIAVSRPDPAARGAAWNAIFADAVEGALMDAGFTAIPHPAHARNTATFDVVRTARGTALAKGASAGPPTPVMGAGAAGVSIGLGTKTNVGEMMATELTLRITRRGEKAPAWEGRAVTYQVSGTRGDDPRDLARKLASALTRNFAAPSGVLVSVP